MLQNRVYRGEIVHKGSAYPGEHSAIVDDELWRQVQAKLEANCVERTGARDRAKLDYLLVGVLFDAEGEAMSPTHAVKKGLRYRYYVSRRLITDVRASGENANGDSASKDSGCRQDDLERLVVDRLKTYFANTEAVLQALPPQRRSAPSVRHALGVAARYRPGPCSRGRRKRFRSHSTPYRPCASPSGPHRHRTLLRTRSQMRCSVVKV